MSIVIYGPQGCGKTRNAEALRKHYGCDRVIDDGHFRYPETCREWEEFKAGSALYLTHMPPAAYEPSDPRHVIPYSKAAKAAGVAE